MYTELEKKLITHIAEYLMCCIGVMSIKCTFLERKYSVEFIYGLRFPLKAVCGEKNQENRFSPKIALRRLKMLSMGQIC